MDGQGADVGFPWKQQYGTFLLPSLHLLGHTHMPVLMDGAGISTHDQFLEKFSQWLLVHSLSLH